MVIYTNLKKPKISPEVNSGKKLVETAGYIPLKDIIANLTIGGLRLQAIREAQYMYANDSIALQDTGDVESIFMDKLDASDYYRNLYDRYQKRKAVLNGKQNLETPPASAESEVAKGPDPNVPSSSVDPSQDLE